MPNVIVTPEPSLAYLTYNINMPVQKTDFYAEFSVTEALCGELELTVATIDDNTWPLRWIESKG